MPRSDSAPPASEAQMREVARQLADSAPPAPAWDDLGLRIGHGAPSQPQSRPPSQPPTSVPKIAIAFAAVVGLLVVALWWGVRSIEEEEPADLPAPSTPSTLPPLSPADQWAGFVAVADPLDVQLCVTRVISNRVASGDLPPPVVRPELLPGPGEASATRTLHQSSQNVLAVLAGSSLPDATTTALAELEHSYAAVLEAEYADGGLPASDFEERVEAFLSARSENVALAADAASCWLEAPVGAAVLDEVAQTTDGDVAVLRCLGVAQLDHALANVAGDDDLTMQRLAEASAIGLTAWWFVSGPVDLDDVSRAVVDAALEFRLDDPETAASLRAQLDTATAEFECPLVRDPSGTNQPIDERGASAP